MIVLIIFQYLNIMTNILITGGAGFIGSNLALKLLAKGYKVTVLDNLSPQIHGHSPETTSPLYLSVRDKVTRFIKGDVCDPEAMAEAISGQDAIIHLAAETGTGQSMYQIERYTRINIGATALMLDYLTNQPHSIKKVIIASSRAIYGEGKYISEELGAVYPEARADEEMAKGNFEVQYPGCRTPLRLVATDEESKIHPTSVYGITKQNQEQMVMTVCKAIGISPVALRYQNVYGPGQSLSNPYTGILSIFSNLIKLKKNINIFEDGKESRDFVYISDVVDATVLALEKEAANGQVFNVGAGVATTVTEITEMLLKEYASDCTYAITGNYRIGDIRHNFADISRIKSLLGFEPKVSIAQGIHRFAEWVSGQPAQEDKYSKSLKEMESKGLYK